MPASAGFPFSPVCRRKHQGLSAAWHRWRPGGPGRYSAAAFRACRVTSMRATQGAAAPVTITMGPPPKPSEAGSVGRGGTVEGTSFAACGEASDPQLVPTKRAAMHAWSLPCAYSPPPPWAPVWGAGVEGAGGAFDENPCEASFLKRRKAPRPFFSPISSGRNGGARRVGGAGGASDKNPAKPPSKKRRAPRGAPWQVDGAPSRRAPRGKRADNIRPYGVSAPDGTAFYSSLRISCRLRSYSSGVISFCS